MNITIPATIIVEGKKQTTSLTIKRVHFARIFRQISKGSDLKPKKKLLKKSAAVATTKIPEQKVMASTD